MSMKASSITANSINATYHNSKLIKWYKTIHIIDWIKLACIEFYERFSNSLKRNFLQTAEHSINIWRWSKKEPDQYKARGLKGLTYDQYVKLLLWSSANYDQRFEIGWFQNIKQWMKIQLRVVDVKGTHICNSCFQEKWNQSSCAIFYNIVHLVFVWFLSSLCYWYVCLMHLPEHNHM